MRARGQEIPPALQPPPDEPRAPVNVPVLRSGTRPSVVKIDDVLDVTWTVLCGPGSVAVEADPPEPGTDGPAAMAVTFSKPGDYLLRVRLSDGHLFDEHELTVSVR